ncbi:MAG: CBS domain-containing protein [Flavobacteriaceae bacterium]|jgi:CBS domain-containing protein|nr:CBS domain-containing protein [Flavobacteriaceae bacterium]
MKDSVYVSTIMTSSVVTLSITDSLIKADALFKEYKIRHLPVVENGKLIGMLSLTDLTRISLAEFNEEGNTIVGTTLYNMFSLEQVMTKDLVTVQVDDSVQSVAKILGEKDFRALPVMAGKVLVGILTTTDLIKYLLEQYEKNAMKE